MKMVSVTLERLRDVLDYDPLTGIFRWKARLSIVAKIGSIAGSPNAQGYTVIGLENRRYRANRLAWFYVHGVMPPVFVDHINGDRSDDRIANLRLASRSQNLMNQQKGAIKTSKWKGVSYDKSKGKWVAQIGLNGKRLRIGAFKDEREAAEEYMFAAIEHFGEFARAA